VFQVFSFDGEKYFKASDMYTDIKTKLKASGEYDNFAFMSRNACIAELSFSTGTLDVKGYFIFINGEKTDYELACYTQEISTIRTSRSYSPLWIPFSLDEKGRYFPGPISQAYYPFPGTDAKTVNMDFKGKKYPVKLDENELVCSEGGNREGGSRGFRVPGQRGSRPKRFYRVVYRDNYGRLSGLFDAISADYKSGKKSQKDFILDTLSWIQGFTYSRTENDGRLELTARIRVYTIGDCDTRSLLYTILLHHYKIDAVLLVSLVFEHAGVGVSNDIVRPTDLSHLQREKIHFSRKRRKKIAIGKHRTGNVRAFSVASFLSA